uniref:Uncharacterized protein n=1 Tax=Compsopogon caeruleus TaxID=31354 RepID=A0A7S1TDG5_9RHOD|mmetsp:Transcript_1794/g.3275  ORF Transcript_1794/g.3275 Transcript_1794/m.3275 type:complete len:250 (+) Transcript_1794:124-873(+)
MAAVAVLARRGTYVERPFDVYMCRTPCERQSGTEGAVLKKTPALTATTLRYSRVLSDEIASLLPQNFTMVEMEWSVDGDSIEEGNCCKDEGDFPQMMDPISSGTEEQGYPDMVQNKTFSSTGSLVSTDSLPGKEAADVGHYTLSSARISMSDLSNDSSEESRVEQSQPRNRRASTSGISSLVREWRESHRRPRRRRSWRARRRVEQRSQRSIPRQEAQNSQELWEQDAEPTRHQTKTRFSGRLFGMIRS